MPFEQLGPGTQLEAQNKDFGTVLQMDFLSVVQATE